MKPKLKQIDLINIVIILGEYLKVTHYIVKDDENYNIIEQLFCNVLLNLKNRVAKKAVCIHVDTKCTFKLKEIEYKTIIFFRNENQIFISNKNDASMALLLEINK